jgi:hypothetical protein
MSRRAGLLVLLVSVVLAVLLAWALRRPAAPGASRREPSAEPPGALTAGDIAPPGARPATMRDGRLLGSETLAPAGFDVGVAGVDLREIMDPARPLGEVRPLDAPDFAAADSAEAPEEDAIVIGIEVDGVARAYPLQLLEYHWAVNDVVDGRRVLVLWDPIAGAAAAYEGSIDGRTVQAGVSGKWYRTNALFYDRESTSLFPAITGRFVTGPLTSRGLRPMPFRRESWKAWRKRHETTRVLPGEAASGAPPAAFGADEGVWATLLANAPDSEPPLPLQEWVIGFLDPIGKPMCCALKDLPEDEPLKVGRAVVERQPDGGARVVLSGGVWPQQVVCRFGAWVYLHQDTEVWPRSDTETE